MAKEGSAPANCNATVSIEVVDVLPWVPAMQTSRYPVINAANASARRTTGMPAARAATTSGLSGRTAVDTTTAVGPPGSNSRFDWS